MSTARNKGVLRPNRRRASANTAPRKSLAVRVEELEAELARQQALTEQLRDNEMKFRALTQSSHDGIFIMDGQGKIHFWNRGAEMLFAYTEEEVLGKSITQFLAAEDAQLYRDELLRFICSGNSSVVGKTLEVHGLSRSKEQFPMKLSLQPWTTREGIFLGGIVHDLREQRHTEQILREETARFHLLQKVAAAANQAGTVEEALEGCLAAICSHMGWPVGEIYLTDGKGQLLVPKLWHVAAPEVDKNYYPPQWSAQSMGEKGLAQRVLSSRQPAWSADLHEDIGGAWGGLKSGLAFPVTVRDEVHAVLEFLSCESIVVTRQLLDTTAYIGNQIARVFERKLAAAALQESDAKYRNLFDEAPVGYHELDESGRIRRVNRTELDMLGYSWEEMVGQPLLKFLADPTPHEEIHARIHGSSALPPLERAFRRKDGTIISLLVQERRIFTARHQIKGLLAVMQDITDRKRAEEAFRAVEQRNRTLLASLPQHVFFKNDQLIFMTVNSVFANSLGKKPEEVVGKTDYDLFPKDLAQKYRADDLRVMACRQPETIIEKYISQGQERLVEVVKAPVIGDNGETLGIVGLFTDVTERKKSEEWRNWLAAIVESSDDAIISKSFDNTVLSWNAGAEKMYGYSATETLGSTMDQLLPGELEGDEQRLLERIGRGERITNFETMRLSKDGRRLNVSLTISPIRNAAGVITGAAMITRDITAIKEATAEIYRIQTLLRSVVDNLPIMVFLKETKNLRYVLFNQAADKLIGFRSEEVLGKTDLDLFPPDQAALFQAKDNEALASGALVDIGEEPIATRHRGLRILHTRKLPIFDANGKAQYLLGISEDITERKRAEEQLRRYALKLEQSNRALQDFASVASHDLQEPLRKVQAFGDRLRARCSSSLSEEGRDFLDRMQNAAKRMQRLIEDLLTFSRVTSRGQPFVPIDLGKVAQEVLIDLEVRIEQVNAQIFLGILPTLEADPTQMRQLLQNLIGNALKFHRPGVPPAVRIYSAMACPPPPPGRAQEVRACQLYVEDNGIGFDEKYLDRIFTVFQRLHSKEQYEGTGVGLAVCRKITERHGGSITALSQPGAGATFIVTLPETQPQEPMEHHG